MLFPFFISQAVVCFLHLKEKHKCDIYYSVCFARERCPMCTLWLHGEGASSSSPPKKNLHKVDNIFNEWKHSCSLGTIEWTRQIWMGLMWGRPRDLTGLGNITVQQRHMESGRWGTQTIFQKTLAGLEPTVTLQLSSHTSMLISLPKILRTDSHYPRQSATDYSLQSLKALLIQLTFRTSS